MVLSLLAGFRALRGTAAVFWLLALDYFRLVFYGTLPSLGRLKRYKTTVISKDTWVYLFSVDSKFSLCSDFTTYFELILQSLLSVWFSTCF